VAEVPDNQEGSSPGDPAGEGLLSEIASGPGGGAQNSLSAISVQRVDTLMLSDVVMAIIESRESFPLAAYAALVRERDGEDLVIHLVLLDGKRQPLFIKPGIMISFTYIARHLAGDISATFGDKEVVILK
jgi:hypothetical protein